MTRKSFFYLKVFTETCVWYTNILHNNNNNQRKRLFRLILHLILKAETTKWIDLIKLRFVRWLYKICQQLNYVWNTFHRKFYCFSEHLHKVLDVKNSCWVVLLLWLSWLMKSTNEYDRYLNHCTNTLKELGEYFNDVLQKEELCYISVQYNLIKG